jgi:hypothetical protein
MNHDLAHFRAEKDTFFARSANSPLTAQQRQQFTGLNYFPEAPELRFALAIEPFIEQDMIVMQTTTGAMQEYLRYGRVHFDIAEETYSLTLYQGDYGFFLPFADALAGSETYGAGRYLEPERLADGRVLIDFNLAYNPYCAYNDAWSCPITPTENRLKVAIRAGEKVYHPEA